MIEKILKLEDIERAFRKTHEDNKKIVLVGGCFDILHVGHVDFLSRAKEFGDVLVVLLESNATLTKLKGIDRPIHRLEDRARILASLEVVDFVVLLPPMENDKAYDDVIFRIKPVIIATTIGDTQRIHKLRQADYVGAQLIDIVKITNQSTSKVARLLEKEI